MPLIFAFALSQQRFELRFDNRTRALQPAELIALIEQCETSYYSGKNKDVPEELVALGRRLYRWLDGDEGWLRSHFNSPQSIAFHLTYSAEVQGLNADSDRIALGLAHLPWELLHDGVGFLMQRLLLTMPPVRVVVQREGATEMQNRPLHLLLMATSPEGVKPVLSYEQEETNIVQATTNQPLLLVTEESGSVAELGNLVRDSPDEYFDVFHVTGHGLIYTEQDYGYLRRQITLLPQLPENTPCLMTEDEVGDVQLTTVGDFAAAFGDRFPRVIFLSGCHTGEVPDRGSVPSMAQALVKAGAQTVLGWARPVLDNTAIVAAKALYKALAASDSIELAVARAIAAMLAAKCEDWHLLRVYQDSRGLGALVTPQNTPKRGKVKPLRVEDDFLDALGVEKFVGQFVGRRRPLQRGLRALKPTSDYIGVFLQGMGGLGKSRLAARMCGRVQAQRQNMRRVVLIGVLDELGVLNKLGNLYDQFPEIPALLNQPGVGLKGRLKNFFKAIEELDQPLILVLDDFEQNIPERAIADRTLRPISQAYEVLTALCGAIEETDAESRLIITCRYECPLPSRRLHLETNLDRMNETDIDKKCRSLPNYKEVQQQSEYQRVLMVADGNPRLLEWLLRLLAEGCLTEDSVDAAALLSRLEARALEFRENILAETLLGALTGEEQRFLAQLSGVRLPIALELVNAVTDVPPLGLEKVLALGLVESPLRPNRAAEFRVTTILEPLLLPLLTDEEWVETRGRSVRVLYRVWWEEADGYTDAQGLEMIRLGLLAGEQESAVTVGGSLATNWYNKARFVESWELCQEILAVFVDYRILGRVARAEQVLGLSDEAVSHYQQALDLCPDDELKEKAATLSNMAGVIAQQGDIDRALDLWQQSLEILERIGDVQGKAATLSNMAGVIAQQGDIDRALDLWQQSLEIEDQIGNVKGKAATLSNMAGVIAQQGDIDRALDLWQQSLEIEDQIGNVQGKAATLNNMAGVIAQQGDIDRALDLWQQSLEIEDQIGNVKGKAATLSNMAGVIAQQGDIDRALDLWQQSLEIKERIGDVKGKAATLNNMAGVIAQQGDIDRALDLWQQSLEIEDQIGNVQGKAATLNNMAGVIAQQGDIDRALDLWQQSLEIKERIGDVQGKAATLSNMAGVIAQQGDIDRALDLWQQSLEIEDQIGNVQGKAATLNNMAGVIAQQGDIDRALDLWQQSLEIEDQIGNVKGKAATLHNMAGVIAQQGDIDRALDLWQQSLEIEDQIGNVQGKAATLHNMAGVIAQQGDIDRALDLWQQSLEIKERIGDVQGKAATLHNMAGVIAQQGDIDRALDLWQQSLEIEDQIGNVQGKAATLANMGGNAYRQGDVPKALELLTQSAQVLGQARAYVDLVTVLNNLDAISEKGNHVYLAQAVWLCIRIQAPLQKTLGILRDLFNAIPQADDLESLLATTANLLCQRRGESHPQLPQLQELSAKMLIGAASAQGIATPEAFEAWVVRSQLNDPAAFLPRLNQRLEAIVGDGWLFEKSLLG